MASIIPITSQQASQRATKLAKLFAELHAADHAYKAAERARKALLDEVKKLGLVDGTIAGNWVLSVKQTVATSLNTDQIKAEMSTAWIEAHSKTSVRRSISVARINRAALSA